METMGGTRRSPGKMDTASNDVSLLCIVLNSVHTVQIDGWDLLWNDSLSDPCCCRFLCIRRRTQWKLASGLKL